LDEKVILYRITKSVLIVSGVLLILLGGYYLSFGVLGAGRSPQFWFGLLPAYMGTMMILLSLAMRIEWFTDARRFW
jgi:hypothetical protein